MQEEMNPDSYMAVRLRAARVQGEATGEARGLVAGEARVFTRLLVRRFGPLPEVVTRQISNAPPEQIGQWAEDLLDAKSLEELFGNAEAA